MKHDPQLMRTLARPLEGLWYIRSDSAPGYDVGSVLRFSYGAFDGRFGLWVTTQERNLWVDKIADTTFIGMIPPPLDPAAFVPHDEITPGLWYVRVKFAPYYDVVKVFATDNGDLECISPGAEYPYELAAYGDDQFIGLVPSPGMI